MISSWTEDAALTDPLLTGYGPHPPSEMRKAVPGFLFAYTILRVMKQAQCSINGIEIFVTDLVDLRLHSYFFADSDGAFRIPQEVIENHTAEELGKALKSHTWLCTAIKAEAAVDNAYRQVDSVRHIPNTPFNSLARDVSRVADLSEEQRQQFFDDKTMARFREVRDECSRRLVEHNSNRKKTRDSENPQSGYVYLAFSAGRYKIGRSKKPSDRIDHFDTQMPVEVSEVTRFKADDYVTAESRLHDYFQDSHVKGEWFDLSPSQLDGLKMITRYEDGEFYSGEVSITSELE